jgi:uncharacterized protein YfaS (alpha-2-macroglobulin family)
MQSFVPGETVRVEGRFTNLAGAAQAVTGVEMALIPPSGTEVAIEAGAIFTTGTGVYHTDILTTTPGRYRVRITCTGPSPAAVESAFNVTRTLFS